MIEEWYKINTVIPFLDHIATELDTQFSELARTSSRLLGLVPSVICNTDDIFNIEDIAQTYSSDLPSPELLEQEMTRWKLKYLSKRNSDRPSSCASALKECDQDAYPNIYILLQIACTLPISSCECERNASTLHRLCNFMRAGMSEDRLTSLALMHIHYDHTISLEKVVDLFAQMHPRRLKLSSVLFDV